MQREIKGGLQQEIQEEIAEEIDEEPHYDFEMSFEGSKSYNEMNSQVIFPKKDMVFRENGASIKDIEIYIDPNSIIESKEVFKLGHGSAGSVFKAQYDLNSKIIPVAIKQIPLNAQKSVRDQFFNDLRVFLNGQDQNLVKFYGCFYKRGYLHEVLQYMDMGSLRHFISYLEKKQQNKFLIEPVLAHFSRCILQGLLAIHERKQIHRDIKPQNILLNSKGEVKITDFGVSKTLDKTFGLARTSIGTITYMSPERMKTDGYSYNCDIWSFGLVLYELATLRNIPYVQRQDQLEIALINRVREGPPPQFLPQDNRSHEMCHFLSRCLQRDYKYRANVQQLLNHSWMKTQLQQISTKEFKAYLRMIAKEMGIVK